MLRDFEGFCCEMGQSEGFSHLAPPRGSPCWESLWGPSPSRGVRTAPYGGHHRGQGRPVTSQLPYNLPQRRLLVDGQYFRSKKVAFQQIPVQLAGSSTSPPRPHFHPRINVDLVGKICYLGCDMGQCFTGTSKKPFSNSQIYIFIEVELCENPHPIFCWVQMVFLCITRHW